MSHGRRAERTVTVGQLARVEGEGALRLAIRGDRVEEVRLDIFEPPRLFEALLQGRRGDEAPDITARICGICPVAYQMTACAAVEDARGVEVDERVAALRRLLYCGEWIQSHALHIHLLHAPDFLGCADAVELAEVDRHAVERGLALKKAGNLVMTTIGGRAVHPVNVRVGGFYRAPERAEIAVLADPLRRALDQALEVVSWVAGFEFPDFERDYRFVALRGTTGYPVELGQPSCSDGRRFTAAGFAAAAVEAQVPHSTALHAHLGGGDSYLTGPLARYSLNRDLLPEVAGQAAEGAGLGRTCRNPFRSIVVRAVETVFACEEALRLVGGYEPPDPAATAVPAGPGVGVGITEAPRGLLLHRYVLDDAGCITEARIMPPTSQNQAVIEDDLRGVAQAGLRLPDAELGRRCEEAVRNHDPCISCAAHFLDLSVERR